MALPLPTVVILTIGVAVITALIGLYVGRRRDGDAKALDKLAGVAPAILGAQLQPDVLYELLYQETSRIVDADNFQLGLFENGDYHIRIWVRDGKRLPPRCFPGAADEGIVGWVRREQRGLLIGDFERDPLPAKPRYHSDRPPRSGVFVPLTANGEVLGIIAVQSHTPYRFTDEHFRLLTVLASLVAGAIQKAHLFRQAHERARRLQLIGEVTRQITAVQPLPDLFRQVVELIRDTFGYYAVSIFVLDERDGLLYMGSSSDPVFHGGGMALALGEGMIGWAAANAQTALAQDVSKDTRYLHLVALPDTRSEIAVPLMVEDRVLGVLDVQSDKVHAFGDEDVFTLEALAGQIAIALQEAQTYEELRRHSERLRAMIEVSRALVSILDLDELLDEVVDLVSDHLGYKCVHIFLREGDVLYFRAGSGVHSGRWAVEGLACPLTGSGTVPTVGLTGQMMVLKDVRPSSDEPYLLPDTRSELAVPLQMADHLLGVFEVQSPHRDAFSRSDVKLIQALADMVAVAVRNAMLYTAQKEEAWGTTALLQVAEAVNAAVEIEEIYQTVARLTVMLAGPSRCGIMEWDSECECFKGKAIYDAPQSLEMRFCELELPAYEHPFLRSALSSDEPIPAGIDEELPAPNALVEIFEIDEILGIPLVARGRLLGLMLVDAPPRADGLYHQRLNILTGIAYQTALAIESANLHAEAAERHRLERELEVASEIQSSFLPESAPEIPGWDIGALYRSARQVGGDFYDFIHLRNGQWGIVIADVADKGVPAALYMALSRTLIRAAAINRTSSAETLLRVNELLLSDVRSDLFVTCWYGILDPKTGRLCYAGAGHNYPLLLTGDGNVRELVCKGVALGVIEDIAIEEHVITLGHGDRLLAYTDGVTEAVNSDGIEFGVGRLKEVLVTSNATSADALVQAVADAVNDFAGGLPPFDDLTLVALIRE